MPGIRIQVDASDAQREGRKAEQSLRGVGDQARTTESRLQRFQRALGESRHFNTFTSGLQRTTRMLGSFQASVMGAAGVAGLGYLIDQNIKAADQIGKTASKIGVGVEALQEYRYAAELSGVTTNTADMALQRFSRRMGEAAQGTGEAQKIVEKYNVQLRDSSGAMRSNMAIMEDWADVIRDAESEQEALRIAFKLFDSEGAAMVNMMREGSGAMNQLRQDARELGIVMDRDMVKQAEDANDQLTRLKRVIGVQVTTAVAELAPEIGKAAQEMSGWVSENKQFLTQDVPGHVEDIAESLGKVKEIYDSAPSGLVSGAGAGIVGTYLLGPKAGVVIGTMVMLNSQINELNKTLDDIDVEKFSKMALSPNLYTQEFARIGAEIVAKWATTGEESGKAYRQAISNEVRGAVDLEEVVVSDRYPAELNKFLDKWLANTEELIPTIDQLKDSWGDLRELPPPHWMTEEELFVKSLNETVEATDDLQRRLRERGSGMDDWSSAMPVFEKDLEKYRRSARKAGISEVEWLRAQRDEALKDINTRFAGLPQEQEEWTNTITQYYRVKIDKAQTANEFDYLEEMSRRTAERMTDNFSDFFYDAFTGELDSAEDYFNSFAKSLLRTWSDMQAQMLARNMFGKNMDFSGGWIGPIASTVGSFFHDGGVVGQTQVPQQRMPASVFSGAPRLHDGLAPDEYPAILQRGETVIPKNGSKPSSPNVQVNVINNTGEKAQAEQQQPKWDGEKWILNVVLDAANRNKNNFGKGLKGALSKA